jgi:hypothetical protein
VPLGPPQIPHELSRPRTRAAVLGSRQLIAWAMALPSASNARCFSICLMYVCLWVSNLTSLDSIIFEKQIMRFTVIFHAVCYFTPLGVSHLPTPKLENHPMSVICDCLFSLFASHHARRLFFPSEIRRRAVIMAVSSKGLA